MNRIGNRSREGRTGRMRAFGICVGIGLLAGACPGAPALRAQDRPDATAISIGYGAIDGDFALGLRVGTSLTRETGLEVAAEFVPSRGGFSDLYSRVLFQVDLLRPGASLVPHLSAGAGAVTAVGMGDRRTDLAFAFGGGIRVSLREGLAARLDAEGHAVVRDGETDLRPGITGALLFLF